MGCGPALSGDYLGEHVTHGYAVTVHAAQGATAEVTHAVLGDGANRAAAYVAMTRGRTANHVYLYDRIAGEGDHEHGETAAGIHAARRGTSTQAAALLRAVLGRDDRPRTVLATAADTDRAVLPEPVRELLDTHERTVAGCRTAHRHHHSSQAVEQGLAAELPALRAAVDLLEVAGGGRSGAGGYYSAPAEMFAEVGEAHRDAVAAVARDLHSVQVLTIHPDAAHDKPVVLAAITAAAHEHQGRLIKSKTRPGVLALPATQHAADQAAELGYADTVRRPVAAVKNFEDGSWVLPVGSLVIVDDADHLHPDLLKSLVEQAATRTNTKLLLITNEHPDHGRDHGTRGEGVAVLREALPWAQRIGTPRHREHQRDNVIDRIERRLTATGAAVRSPVHAEATELLARYTDQVRTFGEEITARERFRADMARSRERSRGLDRDDGLEL